MLSFSSEVTRTTMLTSDHVVNMSAGIDGRLPLSKPTPNMTEKTIVLSTQEKSQSTASDQRVKNNTEARPCAWGSPMWAGSRRCFQGVGHAQPWEARALSGKKTPADSAKKKRALGKKAQEEARCHSHQTNASQPAGLHRRNVSQPVLHGLGGGTIRKPFKDEHKANECDEQFHNPSNTRKLHPWQPAQSY
jgi:hypothetical protein